MNRNLRIALGVAGLAVAAHASAQVTFYEDDGFHGRSFTAQQPIGDFQRFGFNDRASSAIVANGRWEVCTDAGFTGQCVVLRPGRYDSLGRMGINDRVSSVRAVDSYAGNYDRHGAYMADNDRHGAYAGDDRYRRHHDERVYEAQVTSVHAVVGPPEQRCWVERQQVSNGPNVPGAIAGAVIGGILGHQIGGGRGQDIATAGGAVGGAALGANVGNGSTYGQDVQRCQTVASNGAPDYWDVTYNFRGTEHRVQMSAPPGPTIPVNHEGEPRV
jgi:uncharacterized protein YcfJ